MANALAEQEQQYAQHKQEFEKWKQGSSQQQGTAEYNTYVENFLKWERQVLDNIRQLKENAAAAARAVAGPVNVDSMLGQLLDDVSLIQYMTAMMAMNSKDPTFLSNMLNNLKRLKSGEFSGSGLVVPPAVNPMTSYAHPHGVAIPFSFHNTAVPAHSVPSTSQWSQPPPQITKTYRPPSPVRDYRNPTSSMPFQDFSQ